MPSAPRTDTPIQLTAGVFRDGVHTGTKLAREVRAGRLFRVRSGVYVQADQWLAAAPWQRHWIAVAATAMSTDPVFCRATALLLHGVPLLGVPQTVWARTLRQGSTGTLAPPSLPGKLSTAEFRRIYRDRHPDRPSPPAPRMRNIGTRLIYPALPTGTARPTQLEALRSGALALPETTTTPPHHAGIRGPSRYRTEPLELALVDTVSRMPWAEAVVALDWAKAQPGLDVRPWLQHLTTGRMRSQWQRAWDFATPLSESPGESRSRVLLDSLGLPAPALQVRLATDRGTYRVDFCWEGHRVVGEFDGRSKYVTRELLNGREPSDVVFEEKQREDALRRAGWTVVRWTWKDLGEPSRLARYLEDAGVRPPR